MDAYLLKQSDCVFCKEIIYTDSVSIRCKKCSAEWHSYCGDVSECLLCTDNDVKSIRAFVKKELSWWTRFNVDDCVSMSFMFISIVGFVVFILLVFLAYIYSLLNEVIILQVAICVVVASLVALLPVIFWWTQQIYIHLVYLQRLERTLSAQ
jgi:hypothetical protein